MVIGGNLSDPLAHKMHSKTEPVCCKSRTTKIFEGWDGLLDWEKIGRRERHCLTWLITSEI